MPTTAFDRTTGRRWAARGGAVLAASALVFATAACAQAAPTTSEAEGDGEVQTSFRIGTGADNPLEAGVVNFIASIAPDHGITIEVVELEDSRHLNEAVDAGELDGHVAVHEPYLLSVLEQQPDWELAASVPVYSSLLTLSSKRHTSPDDIPDGATVAISEDPSNTARSLAFLQDQGWITLAPDADTFTATLEDIVENPHDIQFVPVDGGALARSLEDVDFTVLQASYLRAASIGDEVQLITAPQDVRLAIILTTRTENAHSAKFALLRETFEDPRVDDFVDENFGDIATGVR